MSEPRPLSRRTLAAQALGTIDERTRAIVPPIHVASTFERDADNLYRSGNVYGRPDNDTVREAEAVIGALEGAAATLVFGSGMSAAIALFLSLGPRAHVVAPKNMYWALRAWLSGEAPAFGLSVDFVDAEDLRALTRAVKAGVTKLVWLETPSNPLWGVSDIEGAGRAAHAAGALLAVEFDLRDARFHTADRPRRRRSDALGDQISERAFRPHSGRPLLRAGRRSLRANPNDPPVAWNDPASLRGVPPDPGLANPRLARQGGCGERDGIGQSPFKPCVRRLRALSGIASSPGT